MPERFAFANLGAEEGASTAANVAADSKRGAPIARLAADFCAVVRTPPWRALADIEGMVAWMNTAEALAAAQQQGMPLWGAPVAVVREVHDKGFAMHHAIALGLPAGEGGARTRPGPTDAVSVTDARASVASVGDDIDGAVDDALASVASVGDEIDGAVVEAVTAAVGIPPRLGGPAQAGVRRRRHGLLALRRPDEGHCVS